MTASKALDLADVGVAVFPCAPSKAPLTKHGYKDASTDPVQVRDWWHQLPGALIGVPCGKHFVVIDCDLQHAHGGVAGNWEQILGVRTNPSRHESVHDLAA